MLMLKVDIIITLEALSVRWMERKQASASPQLLRASEKTLWLFLKEHLITNPITADCAPSQESELLIFLCSVDLITCICAM